MFVLAKASFCAFFYVLGARVILFSIVTRSAVQSIAWKD